MANDLQVGSINSIQGLTSTISTCQLCFNYPCVCNRTFSSSVIYQGWPYTIDYDQLADKISERLLKALQPEKAADKRERKALIAKLRKALEALEST